MPFVKKVDGKIVVAFGLPQPEQPDLIELDEADAGYGEFLLSPPTKSLVELILADPAQLEELKRALDQMTATL